MQPVWIQVFTQKKMGALILLGFASGLPLFLCNGDTLQAWMKSEGVNLTTIGLMSLIGIPYSLKYLWSPLVDRFVPPFLGRRRGWIITMQAGIAVLLALLAMQNPSTVRLTAKMPDAGWFDPVTYAAIPAYLAMLARDFASSPFALVLILIAFLSATQDIASDAYRTDVLDESEMGAGAAIFVLGYRIALLMTASVALAMADHMSWPAIYLFMSGLMFVGIGGTLMAPEPRLVAKAPSSMKEAVIDPFADFFRRSGWRGAAILAFVVLYKLGDALAASMATPFLLELQFTKSQIGAIKGGVGLFATICGTIAGGAILAKIGINRSLWIFGLLQMVSNLVYMILARHPSYSVMVTATIVENICSGLGTAAFVAFLMSLCAIQFSATQYALLSSLMAFSRTVLVAPSGAIAQQSGWTMFFLITLFAALPGLMLLPVFAPWNRRSPFGAAEREADVIERAKREG